ncbi:hypothetical protein NBO_30g0010 [Nosema bombycis CQ1]|uniref:Uncharacterized protein n=1 Tax=Nosema bombycis (strain CQ1 / CVCC 102059) TaxID=578461 RepID=R0KU36_NOSB1|nr:hypothetical protein NBO_30g0010 [Nosema bombycis CQ1]|eukprot:EOB14316.1 hypothetical protein NBO_30g0010 [Nosema bombycis CQ1]
MDKFVDLFIKKNISTKKHTIKYGKRKGNKIYCHTKPIESLEFSDSKTVTFLINLISKLRNGPVDFIEIDCGALIWLVRNNKGLFLFSNFEVEEKVSNFVKDFHNVFQKIKEKCVKK